MLWEVFFDPGMVLAVGLFGAGQQVRYDSMNTPAWVLEIAKEVCESHNQPVPGIRIRQGRKYPLSTGSTYLKSKRIVVTFGTAGSDHTQVLLHELAHLLNQKGGHGKEFFIILKDLLVKYDCLTEEYKKRESKYSKAASLL